MFAGLSELLAKKTCQHLLQSLGMSYTLLKGLTTKVALLAVIVTSSVLVYVRSRLITIFAYLQSNSWTLSTLQCLLTGLLYIL